MDNNFLLQCSRCNWKFVNSGKPVDLAHLTPVYACCGKRKYRCPKCMVIVQLKRLR